MSKPIAQRAKNPRKKTKYIPPIAWDRFHAMVTALYGRIYEKKPIDLEMAREMYDAIWRLQNIYQEQLAKSLPNKRAKAEDLRAAALAEWLVNMRHVSIPKAMQAATGKPRRVADNSAVIKTFRNRLTILRNMGDRFSPIPAQLEAAIKRLKRLDAMEK